MSPPVLILTLVLLALRLVLFLGALFGKRFLAVLPCSSSASAVDEAAGHRADVRLAYRSLPLDRARSGSPWLITPKQPEGFVRALLLRHK